MPPGNKPSASSLVPAASPEVVDGAMMSFSGEDDVRNDGQESRASFREVTANTSSVAHAEVVVGQVVRGGSSSGNYGVGGSGGGSGAHAVVMMSECIGRLNRGISWNTVLDQGMRNHMEDKIMPIKNYVCMPCNKFGGCTSPDCSYAAEDSRIHYFGIFDGHGGAQVRAYCARSLQEWRSESGVDEWVVKWGIAISRAYERADDACKYGSLASAGSTSVVVLFSSCQIIAANCGDSRAMLVRKTETIPLTKDHKPNRINEVETIIKDSSCILNIRGVLRVDGVQAMTRTIGDQSLKPWVSSVPEITFTTRSEEYDCLIIASNGVWDVMTTDEVGTFAHGKIRLKRQAALSGHRSSLSVANLILEEARSRESKETVSVIVVDLKPLRKRCPVQP